MSPYNFLRKQRIAYLIQVIIEQGREEEAIRRLLALTKKDSDEPH